MTTAIATKTKPYVAYVRISNLGAREAGNNLSAENQIKSIEATAKQHAIEIGWTFSDEDVSGQTFERTDWQKVVELIQSGRAGGVVVWNQARASRALVWDTMKMIASVEDAGGRIFAQDGQITVGTFQGQVMAFLNGVMDNKFAVEQGENLKGFVADAIGRGAHLSAPFGYRKDERRDSRAMPLIVDEDEAPAVEMAFELRADGATWPAVAATLNQTTIKPRPWKRHGIVQQARWTHKTVRKMVRNEVYLGTAHNGSHRLPGAHPAIVSPELFAKANQARGVKPQGPGDGYVLTGLVRCSGCGYVMTHGVDKGRGYYRCRPNQHGAGCPAPVGVNAAALEEFVTGQFKARFFDVELEASEAEDELGRALEQQASIRAKIKRTAKLKATAETEPEVESYEEELAELRPQLATADDQVNYARQQVHGVDIAADLDADGFDALDVPEQRRLLSEAFAAVVVRPARSWHEGRFDVGARVRLLTRNEAPARPTALIAHVAGLGW